MTAINFDQASELTYEKISNAMSNVQSIAADTARHFNGEVFPSHCTENQYYFDDDNYHGGWNTGFWTGIIWLCYEASGDEKFKKIAESQLPSFIKRINEKIGVNHHDMGFLYSLSCEAAYMLTGNEKAHDAAISAARHLASRYRDKGEFIQAWGNVDDETDYRLIIDCLMNIPLLYRTAIETGDMHLDDIAYKHYLTTLKNIFRSDGSSYHTFYFNKQTGEPVKGVTHQGYSDNSCWARGQAWGIYGIALTEKYHYNEQGVAAFEKCADYFLSHLPVDLVPYWDLIFTPEDNQPRDSSAAAIAVCGLLEMCGYIKDKEKRAHYKKCADAIMNSLIDNYAVKPGDKSNGLLAHSTYYYRGNVGIDECCMWGDYFYTEALMRYLKPERSLYW